MPYLLVIEFKNGNTNAIGPLCCDNPKSIHGMEDRSIKRKSENIAAKINKDEDVIASYVVHYED